MLKQANDGRSLQPFLQDNSKWGQLIIPRTQTPNIHPIDPRMVVGDNQSLIKNMLFSDERV